MMRSVRWLLMALLLTAAVGLGRSAASQSEISDADKSRARTLFDAGSKAFDEKRYKDAIDLFLQANEIVPDPAFAYNAALAYEGMGDMENALRWSREYLRRAPAASDRAEVAGNIARFERHLAQKGIQQVTVISTPAGATLRIDGEAVGVTPWTGELEPGNHTVHLQLREYSDLETGFVLARDRSLEVSFALSLAPPGAPPPEPVVVIDERPVIMLPLGVTALGLGLGGIGAMIGLEVARANALQDAIDAPDQIAALDSYNEAERYQTGARVTLVIGAALAMTGVVLIAIELTTGTDDSAAATLRCTTTSCGIEGSF